MEGDEAHKPVLKKPTPCRPKAVRLVNTKSSLSDQDCENITTATASAAAATSSQQENSFSELLATAIRSSSSPSPSSSPSTCLFRPKTIRLRPHPISLPHNDARTATSNPATAAAGHCSEFNRSNLVFRPVAKVAKRVYFPSSNAGLSNLHPQNRIRLPAPASAYVLGTSSSCPPPPPPAAAAASSEQKLTTEVDTNNKEAAIDETQRSSVDQKASCDGYNWRKYGQKQVKGSEYPRSYYKCTHPTCPVKKKVERSLEGQVTEIVYKGEHNHSKPQSTRRPLPAAASSDSFTAVANTHHSLSSTDYLAGSLHSNPQHLLQPAGFHHESMTNFSDMSKSLNPIQDDGDINQNLDDPLSKRRKKDKAPDADHAYKPNSGILEPRVVVQTSDADIMEDGFRWRKYGQKVVKGNPYPRSYYKCTSLECSVRKHVERISDDPRSFVTTYEGKHNHDPPQARISNIGSNSIHVAAEAETNFSNRHTLVQDIVASSNRATEEPGLHADDTIPNLQ